MAWREERRRRAMRKGWAVARLLVVKVGHHTISHLSYILTIHITHSAPHSSSGPRYIHTLTSPLPSYRPPHHTTPHHTTPHHTTPHHLTSPHLTSPHLTSPHLTSPHLTSPLSIVIPQQSLSPLLVLLSSRLLLIQDSEVHDCE